MTPVEAYEYTLDVVKDLRSQGIKSKIIEVECRHDKASVDRFSGEGHIPPEKWICVAFSITTKEQSDLIFEKKRELCWMKITFDYGGSRGLRDWSLDWSFLLNDEIDNNHERALIEVQAGLNRMEKYEI